MSDTVKSALVTGTARGIGRAIAACMVAEGWSVLLVDIDGEENDRTAAELADGPGRALAVTYDVKDTAAAGALVEQAVAAFGRLDVLVNNAGIMAMKPILELTEEFWHHVIDTNLTGAVFLAQAAARQMIEQGEGGRIVNVASNSGIFGGRARTSYGASKAGMINMTQSFAIELAEHDILVNAVAPGPTDTFGGTRELMASVQARMPLGRWGRPEEIAEVALFLASDACSFTTGHVFGADGGYTVAGILEG